MVKKFTTTFKYGTLVHIKRQAKAENLTVSAFIEKIFKLYLKNSQDTVKSEIITELDLMN